MSEVTIYHNPRCSKSRQTLQLLRDQGIEPTIVEYLKTPPDATVISGLLERLDRDPRELMRTREAPYSDLNLADASLSRDVLVQAMADHPILIERPIVVCKDKAAVGRPPESVLEILPK